MAGVATAMGAVNNMQYLFERCRLIRPVAAPSQAPEPRRGVTDLLGSAEHGDPLARERRSDDQSLNLAKVRQSTEFPDDVNQGLPLGAVD